MQTDNRFETYFTEASDLIKKTWPKFTDVELTRINGNFDSFLFYLKDFYGNFPMNEAIARSKLQKLFDTMDDKLFTKRK